MRCAQIWWTARCAPRAENTSRIFPPARQFGVRSLGVATGDYTAQQLQQAGADAVFGSLHQAQAMREFLRA